MVLFSTVLGHSAYHLIRVNFFQARALVAERNKSERLLLNILPGPIATRLKANEQPIADVSVLFADIAGLTTFSERMPPQELVSLLNAVFSSFDGLAEKHGLEKIKTIGDAYMVAAGIPAPRPDHAQAVVEMALDMREAIKQFAGPDGVPLEMRIGINTGAVVAGVIGSKKFIYDLWGDTVNTASRMESHGLAGCIQVSESTHRLLGDRYALEPRGSIEVKGKGPMRTWLIRDRSCPGHHRDARKPFRSQLVAAPAECARQRLLDGRAWVGQKGGGVVHEREGQRPHSCATRSAPCPSARFSTWDFACSATTSDSCSESARSSPFPCRCSWPRRRPRELALRTSRSH